MECGVNDHTTGKSNCVSDTDKGSSCPSAFRPKCQIQPYHVCDKDCDYAPSLALALDLRPSLSFSLLPPRPASSTIPRHHLPPLLSSSSCAAPSPFHPLPSPPYHSHPSSLVPSLLLVIPLLCPPPPLSLLLLNIPSPFALFIPPSSPVLHLMPFILLPFSYSSSSYFLRVFPHHPSSLLPPPLSPPPLLFNLLSAPLSPPPSIPPLLLSLSSSLLSILLPSTFILILASFFLPSTFI